MLVILDFESSFREDIVGYMKKAQRTVILLSHGILAFHGLMGAKSTVPQKNSLPLA